MSSDRDKKILYFFDILLSMALALPFNWAQGLPLLSLYISIFLKCTPFENPYPIALEIASFAANLFAIEATFFNCGVFFQFQLRFYLKIDYHI